MEKLKSMTDFVLEQKLILNIQGYEDRFISRVCNHANFLSQTLNISMFVPAKLVDGVWVVLQKPVFKGDSSSHWLDNQEYLLAQSNILFEGFEVKKYKNGIIYIDSNSEVLGTNQYGDFKFRNDINTIEDLVKYEPTLTTTAKKQIGL